MTQRQKGGWIMVGLIMGLASGVLYDCGLSGTASALTVVAILTFFAGIAA